MPPIRSKKLAKKVTPEEQRIAKGIRDLQDGTKVAVKSMETTGYRAPIICYNVRANMLKPPIITGFSP
jgi:hypothetical protein